MRAIALALAAILASPVNSYAEMGTPCAQSRILVGPCFTIHGRLAIWNGAPAVRISRIGSKRILGVLDGASSGESDSVIPAQVTALLGPDPIGVAVIGDYTVCPLARERPGRMQFVCLKNAAKLAVRRPDSP